MLIVKTKLYGVFISLAQRKKSLCEGGLACRIVKNVFTMLYLIEFCLHSKKCQIHHLFMLYVFIEFFIEIHIFVSDNLGDVCFNM